MTLLWAGLIALLLVVACVLVHYEVLRAVSERVPGLSGASGNRHSRLLIVIGAVLGAHFIEVCLFSAAYYVMYALELGDIGGEFRNTWLDFFYFSATSYTTLGVGDLFPHGGFRLVVGVEALTGFVLIGWSASFTYLAMEKFWAAHSGRTAASADENASVRARASGTRSAGRR
jgi:hypothetical protein